MRVIIYVPSARGATRTRKSIEREMRRQGREVVGATDSPAEVRAALNSGIADRVAGRPEALVDLMPRAISVPRGTGNAGPAALGLAPVLWAFEKTRENPIRTVAVAVAATSLAVSLVAAPWTTPSVEMADPPTPVVVSPAPQPSTVVPPVQPTQNPGTPVSPVDGEESQPATEPGAFPPPATAPPVTTPPVGIPPSTPTDPTTPPTDQPPESNGTEQCLLRVRLDDLLDVRLCAGHPSS